MDNTNAIETALETLNALRNRDDWNLVSLPAIRVAASISPDLSDDEAIEILVEMSRSSSDGWASRCDAEILAVAALV